MLPELYRKVISPHLSESQILTLELLILLIQSHREITLGKLAALFPQPIKYSSRVRNLQRFLGLPRISVRLLWFPIVKYWLRREYQGHHLNRQQRRWRKKLKEKLKGYVVVAIDRTQWKGRNILMTTIVWGNHALPVYWELLGKDGSSSLTLQKRLLKTTLKLFKSYPVLVLGDREFHSPKLATVIAQWGLNFVLRLKKDAHIQLPDTTTYHPLSGMGFSSGTKGFYRKIHIGKEAQLGPFNLAFRWKRQYRGKGGKDAWFLLTNLSSLTLALHFYRCRWGIETMFKDFKSGGYHLESSQVNDSRFLALLLLLVLAYCLATTLGHFFSHSGVDDYLARLSDHRRCFPRHSHFKVGLYGYLWYPALLSWQPLASRLMDCKPHKRRFFQQGLAALSLVQSALQLPCHP